MGAIGVPGVVLSMSLLRTAKALQPSTSNLLRRARARHQSTARGHFVELARSQSSLFEVAGAIAEEEDPRAPAAARARVDELVKLTAARMALSTLGRPRSEAERVAEAVAATLEGFSGTTDADDPFLDGPFLVTDSFFDNRTPHSPPALLAVVGEVAKTASGGHVECAGVEGGASAVLRDAGGGTAAISVRRVPRAAPRPSNTKADEPALRQSALMLKGLQAAAAARGDLVCLVSAADRLLLLANSARRTVTAAEWQDAAVDVASCVVALGWTERRSEARALLDAALKEEWCKPPRAAVRRGQLLRKHAFFAESS